jgi:hypothetical protein
VGRLTAELPALTAHCRRVAEREIVLLALIPHVEINSQRSQYNCGGSIFVKTLKIPVRGFEPPSRSISSLLHYHYAK